MKKYVCTVCDYIFEGDELPEDFEWEVFFQFEDVAFPDGSHTSGRILRVDYWYGELDIHFYGDIVSCSTKQQESWAKTVLDIIQ